MQGYDYSQTGYYFVTICVKDKRKILGKIVGAAFCRPQLTDIGNVVENEIISLSSVYPNVVVDKHVIIPNHIHMIICVNGNESIGDSGRQNAAPTISRIIGQWKRAVSINLDFQFGINSITTILSAASLTILSMCLSPKKESDNVLDWTAVHTESYKAANTLIKECGFSLTDVAGGGISDLRSRADSIGIEGLQLDMVLAGTV